MFDGGLQDWSGMFSLLGPSVSSTSSPSASTSSPDRARQASLTRTSLTVPGVVKNNHSATPAPLSATVVKLQRVAQPIADLQSNSLVRHTPNMPPRGAFYPLAARTLSTPSAAVVAVGEQSLELKWTLDARDHFSKVVGLLQTHVQMYFVASEAVMADTHGPTRPSTSTNYSPRAHGFMQSAPFESLPLDLATPEGVTPQEEHLIHPTSSRAAQSEVSEEEDLSMTNRREDENEDNGEEPSESDSWDLVSDTSSNKAGRLPANLTSCLLPAD